MFTDRAEIERLPNQTGRTLEGLPEHHNDAEIHNRIKELIGVAFEDDRFCRRCGREFDVQQDRGPYKHGKSNG